ncbi:MAG: GNAT family N-acetyltransferase [Nocardioidaceae bacterium]|mgnify:CR=1 FL=1
MTEHPDHHSGPSADLSVRVAWADDAAAVARVQVAVWQEQYAGLSGALPSVEQVAEAWHRSLLSPGDARNRVLVALERNTVRGFAVCQPASDPDCDPIAVAELSELAVDPGARGQGHGSRLLQAAADTLHADRFTRAVCWLVADDDRLRTFLTGAGWAPDGAHRQLDLDGTGATTVKQVRLHTALVD